MKNLISASRRCDIPAHYSHWFNNRLIDGWCEVPFVRKRGKKRVLLTLDSVGAIILWTKNISPFNKYLKKWKERGYKFLLLHTIVNYPIIFHKNLPDLDKIVDGLKYFSETIGKEFVFLRYDPIIFTNEISNNWHLENFEEIISKTYQFIDRIIISLYDDYSFSTKRLRENNIYISSINLNIFFNKMIKIAKKYNLNIQSCCNNIPEIPMKPCIDSIYIMDKLSVKLSSIKDKGQRKECLCSKSIDIGVYNTCPNFCLYCYANKNFSKVEINYKNHDPNNSSII